MDGENDCNPGTPQQLPIALQLHILSFLSPDDRALSGRLVSPEARDSLSGPAHCTASLSQPLPAHAVLWALEAGQQHVRQLPFRHKLQLMCVAATSGSEVNLEVALALLRPSIFPDVLQHGAKAWKELRIFYDPGVTAIEAGHPELLDWLLRHCLGLLHPGDVLQAAARHSNLAGLQAACERLQDGYHGQFSSCIHLPKPKQGVLDAAAGSATQDAQAKVEWVLGAGCNVGLTDSKAAAAAGLGDLGRLRWLRERGCPVSTNTVLRAALQHADLTVARWLVDEAGCELPPSDDDDDGTWHRLMAACAQSPDGVAKMQWLRERGALTLRAECLQMDLVMKALAEGGHVDVLQYLLQQPSLRTEQGLAKL